MVCNLPPMGRVIRGIAVRPGTPYLAVFGCYGSCRLDNNTCLSMCALSLTPVLLLCLFTECALLIGSAFGHGDLGRDGKSPAAMKAHSDVDTALDMDKPPVAKEDLTRTLLKLLRRLKAVDAVMRVVFPFFVAVFVGIMFGIREGSYHNELIPD